MQHAALGTGGGLLLETNGNVIEFEFTQRYDQPKRQRIASQSDPGVPSMPVLFTVRGARWILRANDSLLFLVASQLHAFDLRGNRIAAPTDNVNRLLAVLLPAGGSCYAFSRAAGSCAVFSASAPLLERMFGTALSLARRPILVFTDAHGAPRCALLGETSHTLACKVATRSV
jgi:hypothetical protein